jgi:hypothetical protein
MEVEIMKEDFMKEYEQAVKFINDLPPVVVKIKVSPNFNEALKKAIPIGKPPKNEQEFWKRQLEGIKIEVDYSLTQDYKLIYNKDNNNA